MKRELRRAKDERHLGTQLEQREKPRDQAGRAAFDPDRRLRSGVLADIKLAHNEH